jgi:hypothetical protein
MPNYYANPNPIFQPAMRLIAAITQSNPAIVTTTFNHQYLSGTVVRLDIPAACGMIQANQLTGAICVITPNTFAINIDTTLFQAFVLPSFNKNMNSAAQCVPIGEINETLLAATQNVLPFTT